MHCVKAYGDVVGRCRFTVSKPVLKAPLVSALETKKNDKLLSNFAFNRNLRHYNVGDTFRTRPSMVGRCRFTLG